MTTTEAAARLGVTRGRIHHFIRDGRLPAEKFGSNYMIREADLAKVKHRPTGRPPLPKGKK